MTEKLPRFGGMLSIVGQVACESSFENPEFREVGGATCGQTKTVVDALRWFVVVEHHALGEFAGSFDIGRVVEERESLQRRVGLEASNLADLKGGGVKEGQSRVWDCALAMGVEATSVEVCSTALFVGPLTGSSGEFQPQSLRLIGPHRFAPDLVDEKTTDREGLVTNHLCGESSPRPSSQLSVLRVFGEEGG